MHSSVGVPLYLIQIQNNAKSKSHEPKSRQIAPFDFNSWSCETTSKLALNSCSSAAEFFTSDFFPTETDALYKKKRVPCSEGLREILNFAAFRYISHRPISAYSVAESGLTTQGLLRKINVLDGHTLCQPDLVRRDEEFAACLMHFPCPDLQ